MSENTSTDARRTDGGPATTPARPADEVKLVELRKLRLERAVLVGVAVDGSVEQADRSVEELHRLAETAGAEVLDTMVQRRARPDAGTVADGKVVLSLRLFSHRVHGSSFVALRPSGFPTRAG